MFIFSGLDKKKKGRETGAEDRKGGTCVDCA